MDTLTANIAAQGSTYSSFCCSTTTPIEIQLRDHCLYHHLRTTFEGKFEAKSMYDAMPMVKDVLRWMYQEAMPSKAGAPYAVNGELELQLTYEHPETEKAWRWLVKMDDNRFGTVPRVASVVGLGLGVMMKMRVRVRMMRG
jgi:hypothetical protein